MAKLYKVQWTVEGSLAFPVDMFRYDACFPADEQQSHLVQRKLDASVKGKVQVRVAAYRRSDMAPVPTDRRWQSFGWTVVPGSLTQREV